MKKSSFEVPILFVAFNRPDTTEKVFDMIRKIRPKKLFISVDGPREGNEKDIKGIEEVRKIVANVDWKCDVKKVIHEKNVGSLDATVGAINWFFENVKRGIILEDDCLPNEDFFKFCEEMLERYKDDDRIMHIGGNNFQRGWRRERYSYYFSDYPFVWGWASWSRAWKKFDAEMKSYLILRRKGYFSDAFPYRPLRNYIFRLMNYSYYKDKSGWDNNWIFTIFTNNGLSIVPNENLVRNIGFMENSVRTKKIDSFLSIPRKELGFPLKHPPFMIKDRVSDKRYYRWLLKFKLKKYFLKKTGLHKLI